MSLNTLQSNYRQDPSFKAYHTGNESSVSTKALGGNSELMGWLEKARTYYRENAPAIQSGQAPAPEGWEEFLNQMQWANTQAYGYAGDMDDYSDFEVESNYDQGPSINPFGGELGPNGWSYDRVQTNIGFTGDNTRNDVFGSDNTLTFEQPSAKTSFEMTMDHGVQVLKVITTTSKGTMVTYYDSWENADFKLNVLMADETKVSGLDALPAELQAKIEVEKFDPNKKPEEVINQSSLTGTAVEGEENAFYYEVETVDQTVDFRLKAGDNETHYVVGNSNVSLPVSSHADISEGPFEVNGDSYDYKIVVTHSDDSTDTVYVKKPFTVNVNAVEGYTTFNGEVSAEGAIPEAFGEVFTLNGVTGPEEEINERTLGDTKPDEVNGSEAIYNRSENVELHADFEDEVAIHNVTTPGSFTLHTDSYADTVEINKLEDGSYHIIVYKNGQHDLDSVEIYFVKGASEIVIDALPANISGDASFDTIVKRSLAPEINTTTVLEWPGSSVVGNIPTSNDWNKYDHAKGIADEIETALSSDDWQTVRDHLNMNFGWHAELPADQGERNRKLMNDIIRKLVTGIYRAAGSIDKFLELMDMIPEDVRELMIEKVSAETGESTERINGEQWSSEGTANMIRRSLELEGEDDSDE